jgi:hypothetical protein
MMNNTLGYVEYPVNCTYVARPVSRNFFERMYYCIFGHDDRVC